MTSRKNSWHNRMAVTKILTCAFLIQLTMSASVADAETARVTWAEFSVTRQNALTLDVNQALIAWEQSNHSPCTERSAFQTASHFPFSICAYNVRTNESSTLIDQSNPDIRPRLNDDWVVYQRSPTGISTIRAYNLTTAEDIVVSPPALFNSRNANTHDSTIVFSAESIVDDQVASTIMAYDLTARQLITVSLDTAFSVDHPDVYGRVVVWQQAPLGTHDFDIMGYDLATGALFAISTQSRSEQFPRIDQNIVVWDGDGDIYGYDLGTSKLFTIVQAPGTQTMPVVAGDWVAWMDDRNGQWDIFAYDLASGQTYQITDDAINEGYPAMTENLIAWIRQDDGIHAARRMSNFVLLPFVQGQDNTYTR